MIERLLAGYDTADRALGTYLYPLRVFLSGDAPADADDLTAVIASAAVDIGEVLVTRGGGLFVLMSGDIARSTPIGPLDVPLWNRKGDFQREVTDRFNMLVCELALLGAPAAESISPLYVQLASVIDDHALVSRGGGSGPMNLHRALLGVLTDLTNGDWRGWLRVDETVLRSACGLTLATRLRSVSTALPTLVAGAYSHYAFGQTAEAHADSAIATEAIIASIWREHVATQTGARKKRLEDLRPSLLVQLEVLLAAGLLSLPLYEAVHAANSARNSLVHRAAVSAEAAALSMRALRAAVGFLCGTTVAESQPSSGVRW